MINSGAKWNFRPKFGICYYRLVLFNVIEVLPKEKKAREEKTAPIGQGVLDLSSLLRGKSD